MRSPTVKTRRIIRHVCLLEAETNPSHRVATYHRHHAALKHVHVASLEALRTAEPRQRTWSTATAAPRQCETVRRIGCTEQSTWVYPAPWAQNSKSSGAVPSSISHYLDPVCEVEASREALQLVWPFLPNRSNRGSRRKISTIVLSGVAERSTWFDRRVMARHKGS